MANREKEKSVIHKVKMDTGTLIILQIFGIFLSPPESNYNELNQAKYNNIILINNK